MKRFLLPLLVSILSLAILAPTPATKPKRQRPLGEVILDGAREEVRKGTRYDGSEYIEIPYPNGDVSPEIGVCTDMIVRAFRHAGFDLQKLLHEDRVAHPRDYPTYLWEVKRADPNIDHRRCQNLCVFFKKYARASTVDFDGKNLAEWKGGDVVFFKWNNDEKFPWHVAIVSDQRTPDGMPMIVHLFPEKAKEESIERYTPIHSHYRWEKAVKKSAKKASAKKPAANAAAKMK